jgi:hypothetical protein
MKFQSSGYNTDATGWGRCGTRRLGGGSRGRTPVELRVDFIFDKGKCYGAIFIGVALVGVSIISVAAVRVGGIAV